MDTENLPEAPQEKAPMRDLRLRAGEIHKARFVEQQPTALYRCTVNDLYAEGDIGYDDHSVRQYINVLALNPNDAIRQMKEAYPEYNSFTVELA